MAPHNNSNIIVADLTTENAEPSLNQTGSNTGTIVATPTITINDTQHCLTFPSLMY